jgi:hypothetical protein
MKTPYTHNARSWEKHTPRLLAIALLAGLLLATLAHGQTNTPATGDTINPAGIYTLISVDGKTVPCVINHEGNAMHIESGAFTITTNGQCLSLMVVSVSDRKNIPINTRATYTQEGAKLTMHWQNAGMTQGTLAGPTFTMTNEGMAYVYRK